MTREQELIERCESLRESAKDVFRFLDGVVLYVGDEEYERITEADITTDRVRRYSNGKLFFCGFIVTRVQEKSYWGMGIDLSGRVDE